MATPLEYIFCPFDADERRALEGFVRRVDALDASGLANSTSAVRATAIPGATYMGGPAWQIRVEGPDETTVKSAIADFRLLYNPRHQVSATRVLKILSASAHRRDTPAGRDMIASLRQLRKHLAERDREDPRGKLLEEDEQGVTVARSPKSIIDAWFNGEYFHDDPEFAEQLTPSDSAAVEMMRLSLHTAMRDFIVYWGRIRDLVKRVLADPALDGRP